MRRIIILGVFLFTATLHGQLFINEFMASNARTLADDFGEFDDWIELYNAGSSDIQLAGFYLTDNLNDPTKWAFPEISIPANGFWIIWADGETDQGNCHTSFKLSKEGEEIGLFDGSEFLHTIVYTEQFTDNSYGLYPDGGSQWTFFNVPTPGASNQALPDDRVENPSFSCPGGFYESEFYLDLSVSSTTATIHYTLDCTEPTETSPVYTDPLRIHYTIAIRARAFEPDHLPSDIVTYTYFIKTYPDMAVMSLVTDPPNLWSEQTGIYENPDFREWERPVSVEYHEKGQVFGFRENGGLRIHGGSTRQFDKKPFRLYFRSEYGDNWLHYPVFESKKELETYKRLVVHSGGLDYPSIEERPYWTLLRNSLSQELYRRIDGVYCGTHQVALYLNGLPWGIYTLIERVDKYYIETNFGESDFDLIEKDQDGYFAREGDLIQWEQMLQFFDESNFQQQENIETAGTLIDIDQFVDYNILEIYAGNLDWPYNNQFMFRLRGQKELWRWILWDMDRTLNFRPEVVYRNILEYATSDFVVDYEKELNLYSSSNILVKCFDNEKFKFDFINRFSDLLNTTFHPSNVRVLIDSLVMGIEQDITFETYRWGSSLREWRDNIDSRLNSFADERPQYVRNHIRLKFDLAGTVQLMITLAQGNQGKIRVNSVIIDDETWTGTYFSGVPVEIEAKPGSGYRFKQWSDPTLPDSVCVTLLLNQDYSIQPLFEVDSVHYDIVINEINYNSSPNFDTEDWVELYNHSDKIIDISGWHFEDSDVTHDFLFPPNTMLQPGGFLVLCRDTSAFLQLFPDVECALGDLNFGLSSDGEWIGLLNENGTIVDSLEYDDIPPWPTAANGGGPTLELIDPALDNARPESWQASMNHGSPGEPNSPSQRPYLIVNPDTLYFFATVGSGTLDAQAVTVTDTTGGTLQWSAQENPDQTWMQLINASGGSGDQISVIVDVTGLDEGSYTGSVRISDPDASNDPVEVTVQLDVTPRPNDLQITTVSLDTGSVGMYYSDTLRAVGGNLPYHWQVIEGTLPSGLSLEETTGIIQGSPQMEAHFYFRIKVVDTHPSPIEDIEPLSIFIQGTNRVDSQSDGTIEKTMLFQNTPNPFNSSTAIHFQICESGNVTITVYDILGQRVCSLLDEVRHEGHHMVLWDGRDRNGQLQPSGIYFYEMKNKNYRKRLKFLFLK